MNESPGRTSALLDWYAENKRDLPWRQTTDPYAILVSEVMLQQTQVARVVPHYMLFLERFPTVDVLAGADLREVLERWSGLGYNSRAVRLRQAARIISMEGWPEELEGLSRLPGVGRYTDAAIACFGFGRQVAAPDINARRVLSRWMGEPLSGERLHEIAQSQLPPGAAVEWNQALMDLGSAICRPTDPQCASCPVSEWCPGPDVQAKSRPQGRFEGSVRQARGAALRALLDSGETSTKELERQTGLGTDRLSSALGGLVADGLVVQSTDRYSLAR